MGLVKLTIWDSRNKVPKIQGPGVGLAISPLLSLFLFLFVLAGGGCLSSILQVHLLIRLGPPFVFIPRAFVNPIWTSSFVRSLISRFVTGDSASGQSPPASNKKSPVVRLCLRGGGPIPLNSTTTNKGCRFLFSRGNPLGI